MNKVNVKLLLEWEFDKKEWDESLTHRKELRDNIQIVIGTDVENALHHLNGIAQPRVSKVEIK